MPDPVVVATQDALADLGESIAQELSDQFAGLGSWDRADVARFVRAVTPTITAATQTATGLQAALVAYLLNDLPVGVDQGAVVQARLDSLDQAFTSMWHALSEGRPFDEALQAGISSAEGLGRDAALQSARDAMTEIGPAAGITRYVRVANGGACNWCQSLSGLVFTDPGAGSFGHDRCGCSVIPQT